MYANDLFTQLAKKFLVVANSKDNNVRRVSLQIVNQNDDETNKLQVLYFWN